MGQLVPELSDMAVPERQVVAWYESSNPGHFRPQAFPVFVIMDEAQPNDKCWYGFPQHGDQPGLKIGRYRHLREVVAPDDVQRGLSAADDQALREAVRSYFPSADNSILRHSTCLFTNTPDGHFIIDRHPRHPQVLLCSACSGHGFKMSSIIGQALAEMALLAPGDAAQQRPGPVVASLERQFQKHKLHASRPGHEQVLRRFAEAQATC